MATAEQIMSLIRSHTRDDREHFYTVALQIASCEARKGHKTFADDIRKAFKSDTTTAKSKQVTIPDDMQDVLALCAPDAFRNQLVLGDVNKKRVERIMHEYVQQEVLRQHGLSNRRKILLAGPPGTGKTMTAGVLANTLRLPMVAVRLDMILSRYMGESSAKLHQVFEYIANNRALYLFDEFDTLGGERGGNDIGEMRRVLNTLLLCIEQDKSESLLVAATNKPNMLDRAIFRRFDDCIEYTMPDKDGISQIIRNSLSTFLTEDIAVDSVARSYEKMSCADVVSACHDAVKIALLEGKKQVTQLILEQSFAERSAAIKLQE